MAALTTQTISPIGSAVVPVAAANSGDTAACGDRNVLQVTNGGGASINVTFAVPGTDKFGNAKPDNVVAVAAGATKIVPLREADYADPTTGRAVITYSAVTSVTVAAIRF
jgi:hypothetical protein